MPLNQIKKKVLFLITKSNWGGAQRYVYDLATNLDKTQFEVTVLCGGDGQLITMLDNAGIRIIRTNQLQRDISYKKEWLALKEIWQIIKTEKPDVLHVNSSKAGAIGCLIGRLTRVPCIIFTAHGWAFNEDRPLWQRLIIKTIHWLTVILSHKTIAVSRSIQNQMNWPMAQSKIEIIHPGRTVGPMYEKSEARNKIIDFFPTLSEYQNDTWLVSLAELHPIKQHHILISAMPEVIRKYPTTRLVLIGEGQERSKLESQIKSLRLENNVFLIGAVTEAARFLKAFDLFLLASRSEAYGYVLAEAGLAKMPVIASNVGGIPDIIIHENRGLLVEATPSNFSNSIIKFMEDSSSFDSYITNLNKFVAQNSVQTMISRTASLY